MTCQHCELRELVERLVLPIELTNGNEGRTKHFGASASRRKNYEQLIALSCGRRSPISEPVTVTVNRILGRGQRLWDSSSILRGNYKELEDALVACGFFHDDGPSWILSTIGTQDDSRRSEGPSVEISIYR